MNTSGSTLDGYLVISTIGRGSVSKVKELKSPSTGISYAAKIFFPNYSSTSIQHEFSVLQTVSGPRIVTSIHLNLNGVYHKPNGSSYTCSYILMELCQNGNLFDILYHVPNSLSSDLVKCLFLQILSAVESCHSLGFSHKDLKPENVLFDSDFTIKLSDFGSASRIGSPQSSHLFPGKFVAPEALRSSAYRGEAADVFSLGAMLFVMYSQKFAFYSVDNCCVYYRAFNKDTNAFWKQHSNNRPEGFYSCEFRDLIEKMLSSDPERRPALQEIRQHPWCSIGNIDPLRVFEEIRERRRIAEEPSRRELKKKKAHQTGILRGSGNTSSLSLSLDDLKTKPLKKHNCQKFTRICTSLSPKIILGKVYEYLASIEMEPVVSTEFYELNASIITEQDNLEVKMTIYQEETHSILSVKMIKGNNLDLFEIMKNIEELLESEIED